VNIKKLIRYIIAILIGCTVIVLALCNDSSVLKTSIVLCIIGISIIVIGIFKIFKITNLNSIFKFRVKNNRPF